MISKTIKIIISCVCVLLAIFGNYLYRPNYSADLIKLSRSNAAFLLLASFAVTIIITVITNLRFIKLSGENRYITFAGVFNILVAFLTGIGILVFAFYVFKPDFFEEEAGLSMHFLNWIAVILALGVLIVDLLVVKGIEINSNDAKIQNIRTSTMQALKYIDIPIFIGILITCFAGSLMVNRPLHTEIESYVNGFTAGAIAMQVVVANFSFLIITG